MDKKDGFFRDGEGKKSIGRLAFYSLIMYAMLAGFYALVKEDSTACLALVSGISGVAITLKSISKGQEKSNL